MKLEIKNKSEVKEIAKGILKRYKGAQNVAVTSDGTAFITDENDLAVKNHSRKNRYGKKLAITEFTRDDFATTEKSNKSKASDSKDQKTAEELIAGIESATTVDAVNAIVKAEKAGKKRKTVLEAAEEKLESLKGNSGDGQKTAKALIAEIEAATTVDAVAVIVEAEKAGEKRKTVLEAADAKLESLKTAE